MSSVMGPLTLVVDVVEEDEASLRAFAGFDGVGHDAWPEFLPDGEIILETDEGDGRRWRPATARMV